MQTNRCARINSRARGSLSSVMGLGLLIGFATLSVACRTHHEVEVATKEPIRIDMNVRVDIYDHARAIERLVSGAATPPSFDTPLEEPEDSETGTTKEKASDSGLWRRPVEGNSPVMLVAADAPVTKAEFDAALARRKARFPKLVPLKSSGKVGENRLGLLAARQAVQPAEKALMDQENKDRMLVYRFQAEARKASIKEVQFAFAKVQREMAKRGEWIEVPTDPKDPSKPWVWTQKS